MTWINLLYRLFTVSENFYLLNLEVTRGSKPVWYSLVKNHTVIFVGFFPYGKLGLKFIFP